MDILDYYRDNLHYIRALGAEFAAEFPKIAGRLSLSDFECEDPYIERLLEGTAFLSARIEKKLDEGYHNFLESILNAIAPSSLYPIPSGAVLELILNPGAAESLKGLPLPGGTVFEALIPTINTLCRFSSTQDMPLAALSLAEAQYLSRDISALDIPNNSALAALRLKLSAAGNEPLSPLDKLVFFVNMPDADASILQRQIISDSIGIFYRYEADAPFTEANGVSFDIPLDFGGKFLQEELNNNMRALRLLQNFLAYPAFFKFISIENLAPLFINTKSSIEFVILFKRKEMPLANIKSSSLKLNCVPVLNLFTKRSDRVAVEHEKFEYHIVPDKTAPRDYEVLNIRRLEFFNERNETLFFASNFYNEDLLKGAETRNFFSSRRRKTLFDKKGSQRSSYRGTELFVSFSAEDPKAAAIYQFAADMVCSNRDLPLLLNPETILSATAAPVQSASFIASPSRPKPPLVERGNNADYAKLSHIVRNMSSMLWQDGDLPLVMLKDIIQTYRLRSDEEMERIGAGVIKLEAEPSTFRFIEHGVLFFESGWDIRFTLDETAYAGVGFYIFGYLTGEMLKEWMPVNTLAHISFWTVQSGQVAEWKTFEDS
ncbi:MAG: type VI secretion system baseplate subunit TssF [Spirochaetaceae bacterium]|jgi:type VI secretion system VasI/ImpG family protein|nr:type VI secretion system baseplate subunit TssF [Spirochaetaceae bacterium]